MPFEDKVKLLAEIDAYARAKDPRVRQVMASISGEWQAVQIVRAGGQRLADIRPLVRLNVSVVVGDGDKQESGTYGCGRTLRLRPCRRHRSAGARRWTRRCARRWSISTR